MSLQWSARRAALVFVTSIALAACSGSSSAQTAPQAAAPTRAAAEASPNAEAPLITTLPDFSPLVERYGPAVVNVEVVERAQQQSGSSESEGGRGGGAGEPLS